MDILQNINFHGIFGRIYDVPHTETTIGTVWCQLSQESKDTYRHMESKTPSGTNSNSKAKKKKAQQSIFLWSSSLFLTYPSFPPSIKGHGWVWVCLSAVTHTHTHERAHTYTDAGSSRWRRNKMQLFSPSSQIGEWLQLWIGPPCGFQQLIYSQLIPTCVHRMSVCTTLSEWMWVHACVCSRGGLRKITYVTWRSEKQRDTEIVTVRVTPYVPSSEWISLYADYGMDRV